MGASLWHWNWNAEARRTYPDSGSFTSRRIALEAKCARYGSAHVGRLLAASTRCPSACPIRRGSTPVSRSPPLCKGPPRQLHLLGRRVLADRGRERNAALFQATGSTKRPAEVELGASGFRNDPEGREKASKADCKASWRLCAMPAAEYARASSGSSRRASRDVWIAGSHNPRWRS